MTQYRGFREKGPRNVLFLLDEPASNLHSSAHAQLLDSFAGLPEGCDIIYTTHSHHMIKPDWLEGTFVVKNEGLDYKDEEEFTSRHTVITLHRYRDFVAKHPNQTTYFQPVLDVLDYCPGQLENIPDVVMVEGKNDFYELTLMQDVLKFSPRLNFMPGGGAGTLSTMVRLYVAWGRTFIILLDSDPEGKKQRGRYREEFGPLVENRIFTLGDISDNYRGKAMEVVFEKADLLSIQHATYSSDTRFNKTHFARAIQEIILTKRTPNLSQNTLARFHDVLTKTAEKLFSYKQA